MTSAALLKQVDERPQVAPERSEAVFRGMMDAIVCSCAKQPGRSPTRGELVDALADILKDLERPRLELLADVAARICNGELKPYR